MRQSQLGLPEKIVTPGVSSLSRYRGAIASVHLSFAFGGNETNYVAMPYNLIGVRAFTLLWA